MVIKTRGLDKFGSYVPDSLRKLFNTLVYIFGFIIEVMILVIKY